MKKFSKIIAALLVLCSIVMIMPISAFAAGDPPYGFTYDDAASGKTVYKYYTYKGNNGNAVVTREFYSVGTKVYAQSGNMITDKAAGSGAFYVGFGTDGKLYIVASTGATYCYSNENVLNTVLANGAQRLVYNTDDIVTHIATASGNVDVNTLKVTPGTGDGETPVNPDPGTTKPNNRVDKYTNSAGEFINLAYKDGKEHLKIVVSKDEKKVLNETNSVRLTDILSGAKFLGIDSKYNVYLYEKNGKTANLYRFIYGSWYSAEKIELASAYKKFEADEAGFITKVICEKDSYTISQLTSSNKWKATKTYAVTKDDYVTLYVKGTSKSYTLSYQEKTLYLNGKKVTGAVKAYGFVNKNTFAFITNKGVVYSGKIDDPKTLTKGVSNAASFKTSSSNGLIEKIKLTNGKSIAF